jgi:hypothetical protein
MSNFILYTAMLPRRGADVVGVFLGVVRLQTPWY